MKKMKSLANLDDDSSVGGDLEISHRLRLLFGALVAGVRLRGGHQLSGRRVEEVDNALGGLCDVRLGLLSRLLFRLDLAAARFLRKKTFPIQNVELVK